MQRNTQILMCSFPRFITGLFTVAQSELDPGIYQPENSHIDCHVFTYRNTIQQ